MSNSNKTKDLTQLDLYEILGIVSAASTKEIKAAYRKKALKCHPDKNPNNPKAAEEFLELSNILELLTDEKTRIEYDKVYNARKQSKLRIREYDAKRRRLREDLEAREEAFRNKRPADSTTNDDKLRRDIERLQKEAARQVEEEIRRHKEAQRIHKNEQNQDKNSESVKYAIKIKWQIPDKDSQGIPNYDHANLMKILSKYGKVLTLYVKPSKKGIAVAEFESKDAAEMALEHEIGVSGNPLKLECLWAKKDSPETNDPIDLSSASNIFKNLHKMEESNYEKIVLANLKREEERKRIIEQMKAEDAENED